MDVEKYITDAVVRDGLAAEGAWTVEDTFRAELRAALPGILAQHRADVLREEADEYDKVSGWPLTPEARHLWDELQKQYTPGGSSMPAIWMRYRADLADEAVGS